MRVVKMVVKMVVMMVEMTVEMRVVKMACQDATPKQSRPKREEEDLQKTS